MSNRRTAVHLAVAVAVSAALTSSVVAAPAVQSKALAFVEKSLHTRSGEVTVIVTATDSSAAARAVRNCGGKVTSDLWIVNAVAAIVPVRQLDSLAADPAVRTIVENKAVRASDWNGWVNDIRQLKGTYATKDPVYAPATALPDGGFAAVSIYGEVVIVNADGSERKRVTLPSNDYYIASPVVGPNGVMYVVSAYHTMTAVTTGITAGADIRWRDASMYNTNSAYYINNAVLGTDNTVYAVDTTGKVVGYDASNGAITVQTSIAGARGNFIVNPTIAADNTLFLAASAKNAGDLFGVTRYGQKWQAALSDGPTTSPQLVNGTVYIAAGPNVYGFDPATGTSRFRFSASANLVTSMRQYAAAAEAINVAADGTVFAATNDTLYAVSPTGQVLWTAKPPATSNGASIFKSAPMLTSDESTIYLVGDTAKGKSVGSIFAFNRSGSLRWTYEATMALTLVPSVDPDGSILFPEGTSIYRLAPQSNVPADRVKAHDTISNFSTSSANGTVVLTVANTSLYFIGRLSDQWNGRKDVEAGSHGYRLTYPYNLDVGADVVHKKALASNIPARGGDVVVAVVDSGVFWSPKVKQILGVALQRQFLGQADFVSPTCPTGVVGCTQNAGFAFYDYNNSQDGYGHGTHVAGTISNKLYDDGLTTASNPNPYIGVAPDARILSVRVLGNDGSGSYESVIKGIQWAVQNKNTYNVRIMNLSLSAYATVPYFVDPLDRAVERAWQAGIAVFAAAGNTGPFAQSITVPGNDPYVITVGAVAGNRTAAYWRDDIVAWWSATGPTYDGFAKPDILAPGSQIVSFMFNDPSGAKTPYLVRVHPDYSSDETLFRMNGTSMATAVASGVAALVLQANPTLTPDQLKYRLMDTSRNAVTQNGQELVYNTFQQGLGRIWAPDAVFGASDPAGAANIGMDLNADLAHGYEAIEDLNYHYQGPVQRMLSDDGTGYAYFVADSSGNFYLLGVTNLDGIWLTVDDATRMTWAGTRMTWAGGISFGSDSSTFSATRMTWAGTRMTWAGTRMTWAGTRMTWAGTRMTWAGSLNWAGGTAWSSTRMTWAGSNDLYGSTRMTWAGSLSGLTAGGSTVRWIDDNWVRPPVSGLPSPAGGTR